MLLKALLLQKRITVFDPQSSRSIGFGRCVDQARAHHGLPDTEAGVIRTSDALRDDKQHWIVTVPEDKS